VNFHRDSHYVAIVLGLATAALVILLILVGANGGTTASVVGGFGFLGYVATLVSVGLRDEHRSRLVRQATGDDTGHDPPARPTDDTIRLRSARGWGLRHSWWLIPLALPVGITTVAVFCYLAVRVRRVAWFAAAFGYAALVVLWIVAGNITDPSRAISAVSAASFVTFWLGGLLHGFLIREHYLDLLAARLTGEAPAEWRRPREARTAAAGQPRSRRAALPPLRGNGWQGWFYGLVLRFGVLGLGGLLLAIVLLPVAVVSSVHESHFRSVALRTTATVVGKADCNRECTVKVDYTASGRSYTSSLGIQSGDAPSPGRPLAIRYDPGHPTHAEAVSGGDDFSGFTTAMVAVGFVLALLCWVWHRLRG
jgi:hypothetical protein